MQGTLTFILAILGGARWRSFNGTALLVKQAAHGMMSGLQTRKGKGAVRFRFTHRALWPDGALVRRFFFRGCVGLGSPSGAP